MKTLNLKPIFSVFFLLVGLAMTASATPQATSADAGRSIFDRLYRQPVLQLTLEMDLEQLSQYRKTEDAVPATLTSNQDRYDIKVQVRGRYRRRVCDFPPLKLKFNKQMLQDNGMTKHNDIKLVTHCMDDAEGDIKVLREHLIYELYGKVTPQSLRTQLVQITYLDTQTGNSDTHYGILIEDTDEMAERLGGTECDDCYSLSYSNFAKHSLERIAMFEYMIGNTDWSVQLSRNIKNIHLADGSFAAVPYDFDFSGVVDAAYAVPNTNVGQRSITQRVWQWNFETDAQVSETKTHFLAHKNELLQLVDQYELLPRKDRKEISRYLSDFFKELEGDGPTMSM